MYVIVICYITGRKCVIELLLLLEISVITILVTFKKAFFHITILLLKPTLVIGSLFICYSAKSSVKPKISVISNTDLF